MSDTDFNKLNTSIQELKKMQEAIQTGIDDNRKATRDVANEVKILHYQVNGNPHVRLPSGAMDRGLAGKVWDYGETVKVVSEMIRVLKIVGGIFLAALGTSIALIVDRLL